MRFLESWFQKDEAILGVLPVNAMGGRLRNGLVIHFWLVAEQAQLESLLSPDRAVAVRAGASCHRKDRDHIVDKTELRRFLRSQCQRAHK